MSDLDRPRSIISRSSDFWLLGGASIVLWAVLAVGQLLRGHSDAIEVHFLQVGAFFSLMTLFCNHPHFMISYRFGYGRGLRFIFEHWFSLLLVPLALIAFYATAYYRFDAQFADSLPLRAVNHGFEALGLSFRIGTLANFGTECLSLSVLLMYLTVGWHYAKQVFGCMMVYAKFDDYPLSKAQRIIIQLSLFSVAIFNFIYQASQNGQNGPDGNAAGAKFFNIPLVPIGLPKILVPLSVGVVGLSLLAVCLFVWHQNHRLTRKWPSANLLVAWIAFHVWWIPVMSLNEYYLLAIPFFHSLQYLPFAYRMEAGPTPSWRRPVGIAVLLLVGFGAFEWVPSVLDQALETQWYLKTWFFMIAFAVFINVHHFFIDSVAWKLDQPNVRDRLFTFNRSTRK